jgi:hypothetical protein
VTTRTAPSPAPLRSRLLELHRQIVDAEREAYERVHGRVTPQAFLELLLKDPAFAWLGPLTTLIVRLDEAANEAEVAAVSAQIRKLLVPDEHGDAFQQRYRGLLQSRPAIVVAHGAAIGELLDSAAPATSRSH